MKKRIFLVPALIVCIQVFYLLQLLLMPKYRGADRDGALIAEYYAHAGNHDVIFVGDCEVYENFSPAVLWQEYGISSWVRGSPQQTVWQSCCLMEETFRYETPKVMVFNVLSMKYDSPESTGPHREAYNRMTLDGMRWSSCKWRAIQASMTKEERQWDGMFTYLFPILRFHERWSQLTGEDFRYLFRREEISDGGYLMQTGVKPVTANHASPPLADYAFGENSYAWLDRMVKLCRDHGTQLILIKAPSLYPVWWEEWDRQMEDYAAENGLLYLNFLDDQEEIGLDWQTDTYDAGLHLNLRGAEKLSRYFGQTLRDMGMPDRRGDPLYEGAWAELTARYEQRKLQIQ